MKRAGKAAIWLSTSVLLVTSAEAVSENGRYDGIVERNVFNLHPPPKPPSADELAAQNKQPPPKITLTGITTILGKKITFLTVPSAKPGGPAEALTLTEGQAQNEIEVKEIDEKAGVVKVINHGIEQTLDFDHDGAKGTGPAPVGVPRRFIREYGTLAEHDRALGLDVAGIRARIGTELGAVRR